MKWVIYNILFLIVYPFLLPGFLLRMLRRGGYAARMGDRFALYPEGVVPRGVLTRDASKRPIWIHAVSVGEVQVAGQLMREWRKVEPDVRFVFSTTSSTGWLMAEKELHHGQASTSTSDILIYNPLDFPTFVKAALLTFRPRAIVLTESEIWPNFIRRAKKMGIPLYLINARVSDRSAPRYKAAKWFFGEIFSMFSEIFAQSELDKSRLVAAGAPEGIVKVTGSFKFDVAKRNPAKEAELREWIFGRERLRSEVDGGGKILLGGSTWPGEDEVLLRIYKKLLHSTPTPTSTSSPILVIAPRHFEKADAIEANIKAAGFDCVRRSKGVGLGDAAGETHRVYLADTTGELMGLYGIADVVFVGKSLCAHGSQNMIEPCLCGKATFVGPYTENFRPVMSDLLEAKAIVQVKDEAELEAEILKAFVGGETTAARAKAAVEKRCGVVARCVAAIRDGLIFSLALLLAGCSADEEKPAVRIAAEPVKAAVRGIFRIENAHGGKNRQQRAKITTIDVAGMQASEVKAKFESFTNSPSAHLWMPGAQSWLVVERPTQDKVSLELAMEAVAEDPSCTVSFPEIFASYVGTIAEVMPAFEAELKGEAVPEWFVTKEVPKIDWLEKGDVDEDIAEHVFREIRSMQVIRRLILEGDIASRLATDKKGEEDATEKWARAMRRNPHDPLLLERLDNLDKNAQGFLAVGKILPAMKCYETMILINPKDAVAVHNFGMCLKRIGREDVAKDVLKRAEALAK